MSELQGFEALFGNTAHKQCFTAEIRSGRLAHAYIFEGAKGSGRHTMALSVAYAMALHENSPFAEKIPALCSPDVQIVGIPEKKKSIGVDSIRALKEDMLLVPNDLSFRLFILEDAEAMTIAAQNAALKILEEPPANVFFFILLENAASLLPTVRSRAATLRMERFSDAQLREFIERSAHPMTEKFREIPAKQPALFDAALRLSDGCIGKLLTALENADSLSATAGKSGGKSGRGKVDPREKAAEILAAATRKDPKALLPAILSLPSGQDARTEIDAILTLLEKALRDILLVRSAADLPLSFYAAKEDASTAGAPFTAEALLRLADTVKDSLDRLRANVGLQIFKTEFASSIGKAARV